MLLLWITMRSFQQMALNSFGNPFQLSFFNLSRSTTSEPNKHSETFSSAVLNGDFSGEGGFEGISGTVLSGIGLCGLEAGEFLFLSIGLAVSSM